MAQIKLTAADAADIPRIRALYKQAFPSAERMPFWMLCRKVRAGLAELLCIADERGGFLGLAAPLLDGDRVLMAYFAVAPEARGQGAGSLALAALLERYRGRCVFLEIEALEPEAGNYAQRVRRKQFYLRGGLSDCGLSVQVFGVNMEILSSGPPVSFEEYVDFYRKVFGERYAAFLNIRCLEERKQNG